MTVNSRKTPGRKFPDIQNEYGNCLECNIRTDTFLFKVRHGKCAACWEREESEIQALEDEGITRSDVQGIVDARRMVANFP